MNFYLGTIPNSIGFMSKLVTLQLYGNCLTGIACKFLHRITSELNVVIIEGTIPSAMGSLSNLQTLTLQNNRLIGKYCKWFNSLVMIFDILF